MYKEMRLIHYGHTNFDIQSFRKPTWDWGGFKPKGGLWTSPVDSEYSWKDWCIGEQFHIEDLEKSFEMEFKGKVYTIGEYTSRELIEDLVNYCEDDDAYDAIYLPPEMAHDMGIFYGWDCETVLILNPKSITVLKGGD